ncbi:hypothetical protein N7L96_01895 [Mammaliicoccus sciuri]|uniref:hypothetical protein n=1 Tax=Mammaliicoccus sciuri TaxID=1296 RepID=UPI002340CE94|nr:hypothetical protein [Mammaliicoccus sciuri]MDC5693340.1 hypothetical protein [Mammaliicoccus sciuri]
MTMAYEYEQKVVSLLEKLDIEERNYTFVGIDDEVKEVYAKAKAFDEIEKSIIQIKCNYKGNEERINKFIARETEYIMDRENK